MTMSQTDSLQTIAKLNDKPNTEIVDIFYDLKILVVLTKDKSTGNLELSAYETISDFWREMVKVLDW